MNEVKLHNLSLIKSEQYIDATQTIQWLGFKSDELVYFTNFVWERFIHWTVGDDHLFNVRQTEHQRQDKILNNVIRRLEINDSEDEKETPDKALYFYQNIIVRGVHKVENELVLFKLSYAINENDDRCVIIDAVNIIKPLSKLSSKEMLWEFVTYMPAIEKFLCFAEGDDSETATSFDYWTHCIINPDVTIPPAWVKIPF